MRNTQVNSLAEAIRGLHDGATVMVGGFGGAGLPRCLVRAVAETNIRGLTVISNNAGSDETDLSLWFKKGLVQKIICSYPRNAGAFIQEYVKGHVELELVPQGTLVERIRAGGAGLGGILSPVGLGTVFEQGKQKVCVDGKEYLVEKPLSADFALLKGHVADTFGNVTYNKTARNHQAVMATAAKTVVVEVSKVVSPGELDPELIVTPCIFVDRIILPEAS